MNYTNYEVLGYSTIIPYDDERVPSLAHDYARVALSQGFSVEVSLSDVSVDGAVALRTVVQGINRQRGKSFFIEFIRGELHFALWGARLVTMGDLTDLIIGRRDEP